MLNSCTHKDYFAAMLLFQKQHEFMLIKADFEGISFLFI